MCRDASHEIAPVRGSRRIYVLGRPCYAGPAGKVVMGNAQAWHYPEDEVLVLWECYLYEPYRRGRPGDDRRLNRLWDCFESFLMERFNPRDIYTPSWEPIYSGAEWEEFLRGRGYERFDERSFRKRVR